MSDRLPSGALGLAYNRVEYLKIHHPDDSSYDEGWNHAVKKALEQIQGVFDEIEAERAKHKKQRRTVFRSGVGSRWTVLRPDRTIAVKNSDSRTAAITAAYEQAGGGMTQAALNTLLRKAHRAKDSKPFGCGGWKVRLYQPGDR